MNRDTKDIANDPHDRIKVAKFRLEEIEKLLKSKPQHLSKDRLREIAKEIRVYREEIKEFEKKQSNPQAIIALGAESSALTDLLEDLDPKRKQLSQMISAKKTSASSEAPLAEGSSVEIPTLPKESLEEMKLEPEEAAASSPRAEGAEPAQKVSGKEIPTLPIEDLEEMKLEPEEAAASSPRAEGAEPAQKVSDEEIPTLPLESLEEMNTEPEKTDEEMLFEEVTPEERKQIEEERDRRLVEEEMEKSTSKPAPPTTSPTPIEVTSTTRPVPPSISSKQFAGNRTGSSPSDFSMSENYKLNTAFRNIATLGHEEKVIRVSEDKGWLRKNINIIKNTPEYKEFKTGTNLSPKPLRDAFTAIDRLDARLSDVRMKIPLVGSYYKGKAREELVEVSRQLEKFRQEPNITPTKKN